MRRGEVCSYAPVLQRPDQSLLRLIVSSDVVNNSDLPTVVALQVVEDDPGSLLAVGIEGHGWAVVTTIERVVKNRLGGVVATLSSESQQAVDTALRALLEL